MVDISRHAGSRDDVRGLFALAEDSPERLEASLPEGRLLVATDGGEIVGCIQLVDAGDAVELKTMAVAERRQGEGIGRALVEHAVTDARAAGEHRMVVATAAADTGNLRFYQRLGFRLLRVERDAFTPATGYAPGLLIDGIELRDRVWLERSLDAQPGTYSRMRPRSRKPTVA